MLSCLCFSGLVYFVFKYMVDKYNLLYAYQNISASGRQYLHQTAMRFVIMALISLQLATLFFTLVRGAGNTHTHTFNQCWISILRWWSFSTSNIPHSHNSPHNSLLFCSSSIGLALLFVATGTD